MGDHEISPFGKVDDVKPEQRFGNSRLDFLLNKDGKRIWVEVKGCTLTDEGVALFPDAPTSRGRRHVGELIKAVEKGDSGAILILVFRPDAEYFAANREIDPEFADILDLAVKKGVLVYPLVFGYEEGTIYYRSNIPLCDL